MKILYFLLPALLSLLLFNSGCSSGENNNHKADNHLQEGPVADAAAGADASQPAATKLPLHKITLPQGFKISVFAEDIENARSMALGPDGTLYVGTRNEGKVYALRDENKDNRADRIYTIASGLNMPNGVAIKDGALYVAEVHRVIRFDNIAKQLENPPRPVVVNNKFPTDKWHGWKYIAFGPDGKLYVPVGAPCNICEVDYNKYMNIMRMDADGKNLEVFAKGVRNTVGFDWHPQTKELWFTDNGRDEMGDNIPPDELNHAPKPGMHFGYPYCHGKGIKEPKYPEKANCSNFTPAAQELGPHVAALGMKFYTGNQFPAEYKNTIFIAEHGSWNRTSKSGYRVMMVKLDNNKPVSYEPFAEGWLNNGDNWGRPVDVLQMPDGSLLVSDDFADCIYRISYEGS